VVRSGRHHPLPDALVERIADRFRVLSEPVRIRILEHLRAGEATVSELTDRLGLTQQNVSKHLNVLLRAGIVGRRRVGTFAHYRIVDSTVMALCEQVCDAVQREVAELNAAISGGDTRAPATPRG
jgi:DNA-binding transcriptional ArsR family regulator